MLVARGGNEVEIPISIEIGRNHLGRWRKGHGRIMFSIMIASRVFPLRNCLILLSVSLCRQ